MPGLIVPFGSQVLCSHAGKANASAPNPRVSVGGIPTVSLPTPWLVAGCSFPPPPAGNGPCVSGLWQTGSTRVTSNGLPLVIQPAASICAPTGTPLIALAPNLRVTVI